MTITATTPSTDGYDDDRLARVYAVLAGIDPDDLRDALLAITEGAPLQRSTNDVDDPGAELPVGTGGAVELDDLPDFERLVGQNNQLPVHFLEEGVVVQRAVARVQLKEAFSGLPAGSGWGTGSLVSPSLLLTNNHVIPDRAFAAKLAAQFNYQFEFGGSALTADGFNLDPDSFFHTNAALDYTVVRVRSKPMLSVVKQAAAMATDGAGEMEALTDFIRPFPWPHIPIWRTPGSTWGHLRLPAGPLAYATGQFLNVIGHPSGRRKEVALQENTITGVFTSVIRYTTDTEPGSSGSPVFTNGWDIVALHHAGGDQANGVWLNNEGMRVDRIVTDLRANVPAAIRTELGI